MQQVYILFYPRMKQDSNKKKSISAFDHRLVIEIYTKSKCKSIMMMKVIDSITQEKSNPDNKITYEKHYTSENYARLKLSLQ